MTKVAVIGNAGGGKSVLCHQLSKATKLPLYQLDKLQWNPGWKMTPEKVFNRLHDDLIGKNKWIIDGVASYSSIEKRVHAADTVILIDHPLWIHYWWAAKRQFMSIFRPRPDFIEGCPMLPKTFELIKMMWEINRNLLPAITNLIYRFEGEKQIFHLRSPRQLKAFVERHCAV